VAMFHIFDVSSGRQDCGEHCSHASRGALWRLLCSAKRRYDRLAHLQGSSLGRYRSYHSGPPFDFIASHD
jgi:hypothetical protein